MTPSPVAVGLTIAATALGLVAIRDSLMSRPVDAQNSPAAMSAASSLPPMRRVPNASTATVEIRRAIDGHFWADAQVSGVPVSFLLDTGASTVALTRNDARRIGIDFTRLRRDAEVRTAGGRVVASTITLDRIDVGGVVVHNVSAVVLEDGLENSLLGMSFLNQLSGWEVSPGAVTLRR